MGDICNICHFITTDLLFIQTHLVIVFVEVQINGYMNDKINDDVHKHTDILLTV